MSLKIGTILGSYEILEHLGSGGMGEVYRARDLKLAREVAIKLLPERFARDPERLARFRREAQILAQLQHPNIALLYAFEETAGARFLVMELVLGETLRELIKRGPVPVEETLIIGKQIAAAMECAHDKTVVHRDLKPANVKVNLEGVVKVLDFGLAKMFAGDAPSTDPSDSPTLSAMTVPGTILGTAAYMSPEQARGKGVDKRTDIWAFACVLYELLTGKQAFGGEDVTEIIAAVVKGEPDWDALPADMPPNVRQLLRRCLHKDKTQRVHHAADARLELEEALRASAPAVSTVKLVRPTATRRQLAVWSSAALLMGALLAGIVFSTLLRPPASPPPAAKRFVINLPATDQLMAQGLALSPDGKTLVYVGRRGGVEQLYRRSMDQLEVSPIPGTDGAQTPFFSPDGQWVGFFTADKLKKVALAGGPSVTVCDVAVRRGAAWGPDDTIVFAVFGSSLLRVPAAGGSPQPLTTLDTSQSEVSHAWPDVLPGGQAVLFTVFPASGLPATKIAVHSLKTGQRRVLLDGFSPRFVPTGHIVFAKSDSSLWAVPFDVDRLEVSGSPAPLLEGVQIGAGGRADFAVAGDGSLVYTPGGLDLPGRPVWVDRKGMVQPLGAPVGSYSDPRLSPDGQRLALASNSDIWVYELARGTLTRLTFDPSPDETPAWTPDGKRLAFSGDRAGGRKLLWKLADGSGPEEELLSLREHTHIGSWSPDGQFLAFEQLSANTGSDIMVLSLKGDPRQAGTGPRQAGPGPGQAVGTEGRKPSTFLRTQFSEYAPAFSPDGRWIAYASNESGRYDVYVQPYPGPGGKWQVSTEGGTEPVWAHSGREVFYRNGDKMMVVDVATQPTFSVGKPRVLFEGRYNPTATGSSPNYDVTADGQRFLMIQPLETAAAASQIQVVLNWFEELQRRVPGGTTK